MDFDEEPEESSSFALTGFLFGNIDKAGKPENDILDDVSPSRCYSLCQKYTQSRNLKEYGTKLKKTKKIFSNSHLYGTFSQRCKMLKFALAVQDFTDFTVVCDVICVL